MIRFHCPICKALLEAKESGTKCNCPQCGQRVLVPVTQATSKTTLGIAAGILVQGPSNVTPLSRVPVAASAPKPKSAWRRRAPLLVACFVFALVTTMAFLLRPGPAPLANEAIAGKAAKASPSKEEPESLAFYRIGIQNRQWVYSIVKPRVADSMVSFIDYKDGRQINRIIYPGEAVEPVPEKFTQELKDHVQKNGIAPRPLEPLKFYVISGQWFAGYGIVYSSSKPVIEELKTGPVLSYTQLVSGLVFKHAPTSTMSVREAIASDMDGPQGIRADIKRARATYNEAPRWNRP